MHACNGKVCQSPTGGAERALYSKWLRGGQGGTLFEEVCLLISGVRPLPPRGPSNAGPPVLGREPASRGELRTSSLPALTGRSRSNRV